MYCTVHLQVESVRLGEQKSHKKIDNDNVARVHHVGECTVCRHLRLTYDDRCCPDESISTLQPTEGVKKRNIKNRGENMGGWEV